MSNLIVKSFLGLVFLDLCLALALFLSAGSLGFWQAWVFFSGLDGECCSHHRVFDQI